MSWRLFQCVTATPQMKNMLCSFKLIETSAWNYCNGHLTGKLQCQDCTVWQPEDPNAVCEPGTWTSCKVDTAIETCASKRVYRGRTILLFQSLNCMPIFYVSFFSESQPELRCLRLHPPCHGEHTSIYLLVTWDRGVLKWVCWLHLHCHWWHQNRSIHVLYTYGIVSHEQHGGLKSPSPCFECLHSRGLYFQVCKIEIWLVKFQVCKIGIWLVCSRRIYRWRITDTTVHFEHLIYFKEGYRMTHYFSLLFSDLILDGKLHLIYRSCSAKRGLECVEQPSYSLLPNSLLPNIFHVTACCENRDFCNELM